MQTKWIMVAAAASLVALHGTPVAAQASRPSSGCAAIARAIDTAEKEMADLYASGVADNSAPRASVRAQETGNQLQLISINLTLAQQARCTMPTAPISPTTYLIDALTCRTSQMRGTAEAPECDRSRWSRKGQSAGDSTAVAPAAPPKQ